MYRAYLACPPCRSGGLLSYRKSRRTPRSGIRPGTAGQGGGRWRSIWWSRHLRNRSAIETPVKFAANHLVHASGGLGYHLRALRYRQTLWAPFRATLAGWIERWQPPCRRLLVVGPSAGHTLPEGLFARFDEVIALEPDPLARLILRRRQAGAPLRFESFDCLSTNEGLAALRDRFGGAAVLFCNVLGQVDCPDPAGWRVSLAARLGGCHWASWHDVVSSRRPPRHLAARQVNAPEELEATLARFWGGGEVSLVDHRTFRLAGLEPHAYAIWPLTPRDYHLIEWTQHGGAPAQCAPVTAACPPRRHA